MFSRYGFAFDDALALGWDVTGPLPLVGPAPAGAVALAGLQARYRCNDGGGIGLTDSSGNHYDGTFGAALGAGYYPTWTAAGVSFNGLQTVGIPAAAMEGAQTVMAFCTPTLAVAAGELTCVYGYGTGTLACGFAPGDGRPGAFTTVSGDPGYASATPLVSGTLGVTWRQDGTVYLNGVAVPYSQTPQPTQVPPAPWSGLSAAFIGSWFSALAGFQGTIYYVLVWDRQLTAAEILNTHHAVAAELAGRGVSLTYNKFLANTLLAWDGDSITRGFGAATGNGGYAYQAAQAMTGTYNFLNIAVGGQAAADILSRAPGELDPALSGYGGTGVLTVMIGTNDNFSTTAFNDLVSYCAARKAAGWGKIIVVTGLPRYAADTPRQTFNASVRTQASPPWDAVADWGSDPNMGQAGQYASTTYYADGLHPTTAGHAVGAVYNKLALCQVIPTLVSTVYDTFTDANGTALTAHAPDVNTPGHAWSSPSLALAVQGNKARSASTGTAISVIDAGRSDGTLSVVVNETVGGNADAGLICRYTDLSNYWKVYLDCAAGTVTLDEHSTADGVVTRGSASYSQSAGTDYLLAAVLNGAAVTVFVNGRQQFSYAAATQNQTATKHGITCVFQAAARDSTLDNFQIA